MRERATRQKPMTVPALKAVLKPRPIDLLQQMVVL